MTLATSCLAPISVSTPFVRLAGAADEQDFLRLWRAMLEEIAPMGSDILPSPENLTEYLGYFRAYERGQLFGACSLWDAPTGRPEGVVMAGETWSRSPFQSSYGRIATGWGLYVAPEYRRRHLAMGLMEPVCESLGGMGFDGIDTLSHAGNDSAFCLEAFGFNAVATKLVLRLSRSHGEDE